MNYSVREYPIRIAACGRIGHVCSIIAGSKCFPKHVIASEANQSNPINMG
jgi:hypothetical protein